MKILKKLSALIAAVAIFGSTAMAADVAFDSKLEASADTKQVVVNVYAGEAVTSIGQFATFNVVYDTEVYTFNKAATVLKYGDELNDNGADGVSWSNTVSAATITDKLIASFAFDVIDGKSPIGTTFTVNDAGGCMWDADMAVFYTDFAGSITVTSAAPVVPAGPSADKAEGTAYDTYTFENLEEGSALAGKKVLLQKETAPVSGITADTRFVVSDGTRTQIFGGDIWDRLNVEGEGAVKAVNVIFGLIVDAANNNPFTFEVK